MTGLEDSASVILIEREECDCLIANVRVRIHLIVETLHELSLILIACVFTPHSFDVHRTDGTVKAENGINLDKVSIY